MPATTTFREYLAKKGELLSASSLAHYLAQIEGEDWNAEFKLAVLDIDYGARKAVASLGNHEGGELFLGVRNENRALDGSALTKEGFYAKLSQKGTSGDWYVLDLAPFVVDTVEVPLTQPDKRVLVAQVRKSLIPGLVVETDGDLTWYERRGNSDHKLTGPEGVEARRRFERGSLLRELFREFDLTAAMIPTNPNYGTPVAEAHFTLPRYARSRAEGVFYSALSEADIRFLLAGMPDTQGRRQPGRLPQFIATGARLDRAIDRFNRAGNRSAWESDCGNEIRVAAGDAMRVRDEFAQYLRSLGLLPAV